MLELIRRLAEDDKDGVMADKGKHFQTLLFYLKNIKNQFRQPHQCMFSMVC